jgi:hypothetical protein
MGDRMQNKSKINCQIRIFERRRRTGIVFYTVPLVRWQQRTVRQMTEECSSTSLHSLISHQPSFSIPWCEIHLQKRKVSQCQITKCDIKRKFSALVTSTTVFLSVYKQRVFFLCVFIWLYVSVCLHLFANVCVCVCVFNFVVLCVCLYLICV